MEADLGRTALFPLCRSPARDLGQPPSPLGNGTSRSLDLCSAAENRGEVDDEPGARGEPL